MEKSSLNSYTFPIYQKYQSPSKLLISIIKNLMLVNNEAILDAGIYCVINEINLTNSDVYKVSQGCDYIKFLIYQLGRQCEQLPESKKKIYLEFLERLYCLFYVNEHKTIEASRLKRKDTEILNMLKLIDLDLTEPIEYPNTQINSILKERIIKGSVIERKIKIEAQTSLILRQLQRSIGTISSEEESRITNLSVEQLEALGEALLDFSSRDDLIAWLAKN